MGIRTKLNPMGGTSSKGNYKAYIVINTNYTDVSDLGFTENINPDACFGSSDDSFDCGKVILNGKVYGYDNSTLTRIGSLTDCTSTNGPANYGWIISNSKLYYHSIDTVSRIGSLTNWTILSGRGSGAFGIAGGKVYTLFSDSVTQISGSYTTAVAVSSGDANSAIPVAIADNKLWYMVSNSMYGFGNTNIGADIAVTAASGFIKYSSGGGNVAFYISTSNGAVGYIGKSSSQGSSDFFRVGVSNTSNTTQLTGIYRNGNYTYVYTLKDSNVYELKNNTVTKITSSNDVVSICGRYRSGYYITDTGALYRIGSSISKVNIPATTCLKVYGCGTSSSPALAIFEE